MSNFTENHLKQFQENGFVVLENVYSEKECDVLRETSKEYIHQLDMSQHPKSVFSTTDQKNDDYFITSVDKVRFFFEEAVFDEKGQLNRSKHLAVNKIGHGLHCRDANYKEFTHQKTIQDLARSIGFIKPVVVQSMVIFKQPEIGGVVVPHQDGTFLMNDPLKVIGVWIALEDADLENGCLWFIPGSHSKPITRKMVRTPAGSTPPTTFTGPPDDYDDSKFVPVPIKKGSLIVIHGQVVHKSEKNNSSRSREIYTFHIAEGHESKWTQENWIQPTSTYSFPDLYT